MRDRSPVLRTSELPPALYGERMTRPFWIPVPGCTWTTLKCPEDYEHAATIPGVQFVTGHIVCAYDALSSVYSALGYEVTLPPIDDSAASLPGYERYAACGFREQLRPQQKEALRWAAARAYCFLELPMRTGKTPIGLAVSEILGTRSTIVWTEPRLVYNWCREIAKWTHKAPILLEGRSGRRARRLCMACRGSGLLNDSPCPDCRTHNGQSFGWQVLDVRRVERRVEIRRAVTGGPNTKVNLLPGRVRPTQEAYCCTTHRDVVSTDPNAYCGKCYMTFLEALVAAPYLVAGYDSAIGEADKDETGAIVGDRLDLPGFAGLIRWLGVDLAICDEVHELRGRPNWKDVGNATIDAVAYALTSAKRTLGLSATMLWNFTRDYYQQLNVLSGGLFGTYKDFDIRYACGRPGPHGGWVADGTSALADTELKERLEHLVLHRELREMWPADQTPDAVRQAVWVEPATPLPAIAQRGTVVRQVERAYETTLSFKLDTIVHNVISELHANGSCIVTTYTKRNADLVYAALCKAAASKSNKKRLQDRHFHAWLCHTDSASMKTRHGYVDEFRSAAQSGHAVVLVGTIGALATGSDLSGATSMHIVDVHGTGGELEQLEARARAFGRPGYGIYYYVVRGSTDERAADRVLRRLADRANFVGSDVAKGIRDAFDRGEISEDAYKALYAAKAAQDNEDDGPTW